MVSVIIDIELLQREQPLQQREPIMRPAQQELLIADQRNIGRIEFRTIFISTIQIA